VDDEMFGIMRDALEESQGERKRFVQEQTLRLQNRYQTLQSSLDTAYEDRLRDMIDEAMFKRKGSDYSNSPKSLTDSTLPQIQRNKPSSSNASARTFCSMA
jgi:DNA replication initiation complex subunit (GINS family)